MLLLLLLLSTRNSSSSLGQLSMHHLSSSSQVIASAAVNFSIYKANYMHTQFFFIAHQHNLAEDAAHAIFKASSR